MSSVTIDKAAPSRNVKYGSMSRDRTWALRWSYFFLTLFAIFSLLPPIYMLITSLKSSAEISAATNPWWVFHPTLDNYIGLLTSNQFLRFFWNSALVSIFVVTITMLISVPAAFALARMRFWGSATLATGVFLTYLIPDSLLFIPLFKVFALFGDWTGIQLINRWYVLLLIYPTLSNYVELLTSNQFLTFFRNSALVSIIVVTITMLISVPAAFALSRMRFWGSATLATGVFLTYLIPDTLLFLPLFKMFAVFGDWTGIQLINRWYVLLLVYPTLTVPFCTWIMIGYFASIPKELDEAAIIDGASWFQTLTRIFIPVALPGIIAATIFAFTVSWAQFLYPLVFTTSTDQLVLPVGIITSLIKGDVFNWGQIMTGALLGAAPPLIIYAFLMDYYIAGLTAGATKG